MNDIDPLTLASELIRRPSVTPDDHGAQAVVERALTGLGFRCATLSFEAEGEPQIENLYARWGEKSPNLCFAGHTDVVPPGDVDAWISPPFDAAIVGEMIYGRGAADMKGAIAAFIAAAGRQIAAGGVTGSISLLITGDEEGSAVNGTRKVLEWMKENGERIDHCIVGEPSNQAALGDMIKAGRRGSINCWLTVIGRQGHVAYPDRARNPIHDLTRLIAALIDRPLDDGYERFQPTTLQFTNIDVGNPAHNVIPAKATARFSIRFNPTWTGETIEAHLRRELDALAANLGAAYELKTIVSGEAFLTTDEAFLNLIADAAETKTGRRAAFSTTGGTSDARFIKNYAPVAEFGLVGATMHQVDEHVAVADIETLTDIYAELIARYFDAGSAP